MQVARANLRIFNKFFKKTCANLLVDHTIRTKGVSILSSFYLEFDLIIERNLFAE